MLSSVVCHKLSLVFFHNPHNLLKSFWLIHVCQLHDLLNYVGTTVSIWMSVDPQY